MKGKVINEWVGERDILPKILGVSLIVDLWLEVDDRYT